VLLTQPPQVVQHTLEQAEDLVLCRERPDQRKKKLCCQQLLDGAYIVLVVLVPQTMKLFVLQK
jgi:hypothetical protein